MKNLIFYFCITLIVTSCGEQEILTTSDQHMYTEASQDQQSINLVEESFQADLEMTLQILEEGYKIEVLYQEEGYEFNIVLNRDNLSGSRAERCRGNGISFVKCVKAAVDEHGCQTITSDGDDYVSNDC